jgi:hypothetical protein
VYSTTKDLCALRVVVLGWELGEKEAVRRVREAAELENLESIRATMLLMRLKKDVLIANTYHRSCSIDES